MDPLLLALLLGLTAAAATAVGGAIVVQRRWERRYLRYFVALGSGFMLATALLEMLPASIARTGEKAAMMVLAGYLIVHFFEHTLAPHFHFGEETHHNEFLHQHKIYSVLLGLGIHAFFDGLAIGSGFVISNWLGWVIFLAVFLHKMPEGFTVSSIMLAAGKSRAAAWWSSAFLGGATVLGVVVIGVSQSWVNAALPLSAGATLYVAASDLMPEVNKEPGVAMAVVVFLGVAVLFALDAIFHVH